LKKKKTASKSERSTPVHFATPDSPAASRPASASDSQPLWPRLWPYLLLIALAFGIYANALGNGFVSDDDNQLLGNPLVREWRQLPQIFEHDVWAFSGQETATNYYRPIQTVVYLALYSAFGFDAFVFHLAMVLIHVVNTLLVFSLGKRLLNSRSPALVAGIVFAVHPIHNQAVVWIAVLPDVLLTSLVLTALLIFVRGNAAPRPAQVGALCGLYFLALLTKEPGAMLLPLLAGYEFFYLGRSVWPPALSSQSNSGEPTIWDNWALYGSLLGVFGVYLLLRIHALGGIAPGQALHHALHGQTLILSIIATLGQYLGKLVAPIHLSYFYSFQATTSVTLPVILSLAIELGLLAAIIRLRARTTRDAPAEAREAERSRKSPRISYALCLMLTPLVPALNINGVGQDVFAERYLYLPSVGFVFIVAMAWEWLAAKHREAAWAALAVTVVASAWILEPRNLDWHDDLRLFTVSAAQSPNSGTVVGNLGWLEYQKGEYDAAIENLRLALQTQPEPVVAAILHDDLGNAYLKKGRTQDAVAEFRQAFESNARYADAHWHLGLALEFLGDPTGAIVQYQKAVELRPAYAEAYTSLALLRMKDKDYPAAIDLLDRAVAANPRSFEAYSNLGVVYNDTSRYAEASVAFRKAIAAQPDNPMAYATHYNLGLSYSHLGLGTEAAREFSRALQLKPDLTPAREALTQMQNALRQQSAK
jgi:tetratricopeptide (TPR) repeat protein